MILQNYYKYIEKFYKIKNIYLNSNELLSLQEITKIFNLFDLNGINVKKSFNNKYFSKEEQLIKDKNINKLNRKYDKNWKR